MVEREDVEVERDLANGLFAWLQQEDDTPPPPLNSRAQTLLAELSVDRDNLPPLKSLIDALGESYVLPLRIYVSGFEENVIRQLDGDGVFDEARQLLREACAELFAPMPAVKETAEDRSPERVLVTVDEAAPTAAVIVQEGAGNLMPRQKHAKQLGRDPVSRRAAFLDDLGIARGEDLSDQTRERLTNFMIELYTQIAQQTDSESTQRSLAVIESFLAGQLQREIAGAFGISTATVSIDRRRVTEDLRYFTQSEALDKLVRKMCTGRTPTESDVSDLFLVATERIEARLKHKLEKQLGRRATEIVAQRPQPLADSDVAEFLGELADSSDEDLDWQEKALCAQTDPEAFFPEKGGSTREAKQVCQSCEVREECLDAALQNDERFGIWGGLSERERRKLKKRAV